MDAWSYAACERSSPIAGVHEVALTRQQLGPLSPLCKRKQECRLRNDKGYTFFPPCGVAAQVEIWLGHLGGLMTKTSQTHSVDFVLSHCILALHTQAGLACDSTKMLNGARIISQQS